MCGAGQPHSRHALRFHRVCEVPRPPHSRHALILHRVCAVQVSPTLDTLCASTGYVRCKSSPLSTRSAPPQGMCGAGQPHSRHALRLHRVCAVQVSPTLDTLCASTGYVRCNSAPLSTRSAPPQGMCGAIQPHSRQLCASTGYVRCGSAPLSTRSAPPQGMCGAGQPHSRHALRLHHVLLRKYLSVVNRSFRLFIIIIIIIIIITIIDALSYSSYFSFNFFSFNFPRLFLYLLSF